MIKKSIAALLIAMLAIGLVACGNAGDLDEAAAVRDIDAAEAGVVYIDEEAIALVGSVQEASMTEEQRQRSAELRVMAVEAFDLTNARRTAQGLSALVWSNDLELAALVRSSEIVSTFSHTRPNGSDWYTVNSNLMWAENLARKFTTAAGAVEGWVNSASHNQNIMDTGFTTMSVAVYEVDGVLYFAQEFGY